jgi:hypothetical protein
MTHTPATRGALVDALLSYADKHPATWAADEAKALLREAAAAIARPADGWVLVPIEPTEAMWKDGAIVCGGHVTRAIKTYVAMISASPTPPASDTAASVQQGEG